MRRNMLGVIGLGLVLGLGTITGCSKQEPEVKEEEKEKEPIGMAKAKSIALKEAGVKEEDVTFTKEKFDEDEKRPKYEMDFNTEDTEFEFDIDAYSGDILKGERIDKETNVTEPTANQQQQAQQQAQQQQQQVQQQMITEGEAISIACETIGFSQPDELLASYTEVDDGMEVWVIKMKANNTYYDVELDVYTGKVYNIEQSATLDD